MRLDQELVQRNLYPTRAKAVVAIDSGLVMINSVLAKKPSQSVNKNDVISAHPLPYVSGRGSLKLAHALDKFDVNPNGYICLDVGASTGGFTEALLGRGAARVIAVDVGSDQMVAELKNDPRVLSLEMTDIRDLYPNAGLDLIVIDVSFISLDKIVSAVAAWGAPKIIALIKPQFEVPREISAKNKGIIKSATDRKSAIDNVIKAFAGIGYMNKGVIESPIKGGSGNIEYLALFLKS